MKLSIYPGRVSSYEVAEHLGATVPFDTLVDVVQRYFTDDRINWLHEKQRRAVAEEYQRAWNEWSTNDDVKRALLMTEDMQAFLHKSHDKVFEAAVLRIVERYGG